MPGIINLHGHVGNVIGLVQDPKNYTRANTEHNLKTYASYGVTTVISMGSEQDLAFQIRSEQRAGRPTYTRLYHGRPRIHRERRLSDVRSRDEGRAVRSRDTPSRSKRTSRGSRTRRSTS